MAVQISLRTACQVADLEPYLDPDLVALVEGCKSKPEDVAPRSLLSDWLRDHGEIELADAVAWANGRGIFPQSPPSGYEFWRWCESWSAGNNSKHKLPLWATNFESKAFDGTTFLGAYARLAELFDKIRSELLPGRVVETPPASVESPVVEEAPA